MPWLPHATFEGAMGLLRASRSFALVSAILLSACVVRLSDRNEPLTNGGVTGGILDCSAARPLAKGAPGTDAKTKFVGRYDFTNPAKPAFDWSGNFMSARFEGSLVTWGFEAGVEIVFEVIIDGAAPQEVILGGKRPATSTHELSSGVHEITVMRSSEALFGAGSFVPFTFPGGRQLPPTERPRRIEYIGDSITCGYGNEGENATCPYDVEERREKNADGTETVVKIPRTQNVALAYGSLAAAALDADAVTLCFSGKGMIQNYREQTGEYVPLEPGQGADPDAKTLIPDYYKRTFASEPQSPAWDFTKEPEPAVVVINVGTNDFSRDVDQNSVAEGLDLNAFQDGYRRFVDVVRGKRPKAHIFLALPPMVTDKFPLDNARTDFRRILNTIVREMNAAGDSQVYFIELVEMGTRYGLGCDYHPNLEVHRIMAQQVAGAIRTKTCW